MIALLAGCSREVAAGTVLEALTESGEPVTLRIDAVAPDALDPPGELQLYEVSQQSGGEWRPYCVADRFGSTAALALGGSWDERGEHHP